MRKLHIVLLAGLALMLVFLLAAAYAFLLERPPGTAVESAAAERWTLVAAVTVMAALAAAVPLAVALRHVAPSNTAAAPTDDAPDAEPSATELDYQLIAETAQDAIVCADQEGLIVACNRVAETMFGYRGEEMFGHPVTMLMPPRHRAAHTSGLARVGAGGEPRIIGHTVELTGRRDDGSEFPLELSLSTWHSGGQRGYTGIIRDITARKREEEALRRSEERLRRLLETAPDAVVVCDADGTIVSWNPGARALFGYEEDEALGQNVSRLMPERYRDRHRAGLRRLRDTGEAHLVGKTVGLHGLHKDGGEFPLELSLGCWTAGEETFFSAIIREVGKLEPAGGN